MGERAGKREKEKEKGKGKGEGKGKRRREMGREREQESGRKAMEHLPRDPGIPSVPQGWELLAGSAVPMGGKKILNFFFLPLFFFSPRDFLPVPVNLCSSRGWFIFIFFLDGRTRSADSQ